MALSDNVSVSMIGFLVAMMFLGTLSEEIASPLKVAQCRAACIYSFSRENETSPCLKNEECLSCWKSCQRLQFSYKKLCLKNSDCDVGCKAACRFAEEASNYVPRAPVLVQRGEEVLMNDGHETKWPKPSPELEGPWVYLVMRRLKHPGSSWRQITQTLDRSARIPTGGMVRVLVVNRSGLATIYGPAEEIARREDKGWRLREVSVIHQEAVVIAEIAWESRHPGALYLVTWEVAGGGLRGNLLLSSTCVALSLWPDTQFHVQVELMNPGAMEQQKSEELIVDTHKGLDNVILPQSDDPQTSLAASNSLLLSVLNSTRADIQMSDPRQLLIPSQQLRVQFIAAGLAALLAVLIVVLVVRACRARSSANPHSKLIEDDYLTADLYKVVSHNAATEKPKSTVPAFTANPLIT
ncbi:hypothetical protein LSTR_LSTR009222 [Laodelphax striatellus]|uniref:Uncharacterized protein n=1 Tax=Laodelphax striatellus TaxID=195883 RepID=A0A482WRA4_LAOST|nr:hypothetical protein LSTR_LSTR009222 [Laodelphax striatellus]